MSEASNNNHLTGTPFRERGRIRIKVCGLTNVQQVRQLNDLGIEFVGFNFYPRSPRYVYKNMPATAIKKIRSKINKVGIFVNEDPEELLRTVDECGLYLVQLHGDESPRYCEKISNYIGVIKVFRLSENDNIEWKIKDYYDAADMFMFDTSPLPASPDKEGASTLYGGTGKKFNWKILKDKEIKKSFFLAGGIAPNDVDELKNFTSEKTAKDLFAIDINSRFEIMPGIKDIDKIKTFCKKLSEPYLPNLFSE